MRYALCYVSTASKYISREEIKELLEQSEEQNPVKNIKGLLLYSEGNFLQILEGEKREVLQLYSKIENDPRHHTVIQILGREVRRGSYDSYKAAVVSENYKYRRDLPEEYISAFNGMDEGVQQILENILEVYVMTRP